MRYDRRSPFSLASLVGPVLVAAVAAVLIVGCGGGESAGDDGTTTRQRVESTGSTVPEQSSPDSSTTVAPNVNDTGTPVEVTGTFEAIGHCTQVRSTDGHVYDLVMSARALDTQMISADGEFKVYTTAAEPKVKAVNGDTVRVRGEIPESEFMKKQTICADADLVLVYFTIDPA